MLEKKPRGRPRLFPLLGKEENDRELRNRSNNKYSCKRYKLKIKVNRNNKYIDDTINILNLMKEINDGVTYEPSCYLMNLMKKFREMSSNEIKLATGGGTMPSVLCPRTDGPCGVEIAYDGYLCGNTENLGSVSVPELKPSTPPQKRGTRTDGPCGLTEVSTQVSTQVSPVFKKIPIKLKGN